MPQQVLLFLQQAGQRPVHALFFLAGDPRLKVLQLVLLGLGFQGADAIPGLLEVAGLPLAKRA